MVLISALGALMYRVFHCLFGRDLKAPKKGRAGNVMKIFYNHTNAEIIHDLAKRFQDRIAGVFISVSSFRETYRNSLSDLTDRSEPAVTNFTFLYWTFVSHTTKQNEKYVF